MIGATLGSYTIERELGRGGMGAVYTAVHTLLGRRAAVKVLLAALSRDQGTVQRFFNEARAASAIKHPSIVEIYDFGWAPDGAAFIVMELMEGESLATRLARVGRMPVATALVLARQIATALAAAHKAGIVHRDLKPDNAFLVPDPEVNGGERVKLLDFGIAKLVSDTGGGAKTTTGAILGTPHYMSPEQCEGSRAVDHRTDLYALGCMLFQMISGRLPFEGEGVGGIIGMHLYVPAPALRSVAPDAPAAVEALVARLLAKAPADRPAAADEVVGLLSQLGVPSGVGAAVGPADVRAIGLGPTLPHAPSMPPPITTLSGSSASGPAAPGRGRTGLVIAAAVVVVAGVVAAVIATGGGTAPGPGPVARAGVDAAAPTEAAPTGAALADAALSEAVLPDATGDALYAQAQAAIADRRWDTALALAQDLATVNHPMAAPIKSQATSGKRAADAVTAMQAALERADFHQVRLGVDRVYDSTLDGDPDRARADDLVAQARPAAIAKAEADVARLARAGKCMDARTIAAVVAADWGTDDTAAITRAAQKCKAASSGGASSGDAPGTGHALGPAGPADPPPPVRDAAALLREASDAAKAAQWAKALRAGEAALAHGGLGAKDRDQALTIAALAACNLKSPRARKFYEQLSSSRQAMVRQRCLANGVSLD